MRELSKIFLGVDFSTTDAQPEESKMARWMDQLTYKVLNV